MLHTQHLAMPGLNPISDMPIQNLTLLSSVTNSISAGQFHQPNSPARLRLQSDKTRRHGTETTTLMMSYKLIEQALKRWQKLRGSNMIEMVITGYTTTCYCHLSDILTRILHSAILLLQLL